MHVSVAISCQAEAAAMHAAPLWIASSTAK
eukprot:COSAG04_NODE_21778_length_367_cov_1.548507_1_plen_30_part_01